MYLSFSNAIKTFIWCGNANASTMQQKYKVARITK